MGCGYPARGGGTPDSSSTGGACGDNLTWELRNGTTLTISGPGAMYDFSDSADAYPPWLDYTEFITAVQLPEELTYIGMKAFATLPMTLAGGAPESWDISATIYSRPEHPVTVDGLPYLPEGYQVEKSRDGYY